MENTTNRENDDLGTITTAADLMRLDLEEDSLMLDELSLCSVCSHTCYITAS